MRVENGEGALGRCELEQRLPGPQYPCRQQREGREEEEALAGLQTQLCTDPKMKDRVQARNFSDPMRVCTGSLFNLHPDPQVLA